MPAHMTSRHPVGARRRRPRGLRGRRPPDPRRAPDTAAAPFNGSSALDAALGALFTGPTPAEARRGLRSSIPAAARLRGSSVDGGVATVDVSGGFASGPPRVLQPRMGQLVFTATAVRGVDRVRIRIDGTTPDRLGGVALDPPLTRATFAHASSGGPEDPKVGGAPSALVHTIPVRLIALGYLPPGADGGIAGPRPGTPSSPSRVGTGCAAAASRTCA